MSLSPAELCSVKSGSMGLRLRLLLKAVWSLNNLERAVSVYVAQKKHVSGECWTLHKLSPISDSLYKNHGKDFKAQQGKG